MSRNRRLLSVSVLISALFASVASATPVSGVKLRHPVGAAPRWFSTDLARRAEAAGAAGVPLAPEARAQIPVSSLAFLGIRPGGWLFITNSTDLLQGDYISLCTANFLFTDGSVTIPGASGAVSSTVTTKPTSSKKPAAQKGTRSGGTGNSPFAIGTAGHCGKPGEKVFMVFAPGVIKYIGDITKSTGEPPQDKLSPDFALISIRPEFNAQVSPSMAHWGGPTGIYVPPSPNTVVPVLHSGHGVVIGTGGTPRAGVAYKWGQEYRFEGAVIFGDSGSAAIVAGGLAAGNVTHIAVNTGQTIPAWNGGTSIAKIMSLVGGYKLAICKSPIPWPVLGCPPV